MGRDGNEYMDYPIGLAGKMVMNILKKDVIIAASSLNVGAGQEADVEAATYAMYDIYNDEHSKGVLLVDAENYI